MVVKARRLANCCEGWIHMVANVSVIIPTHNRPEMLYQAIASVQQQTYRDWEIVIVDDGSQPAVDADALTKQFGPNIRVIRNELPVKLNTARDQGVQAATGDIIIQLDDDDKLAPEALKKAVSALTSNKDLELVFLGVKGFGDRAIHFDSAQAQALNNVLTNTNGQPTESDLIHFDSEIFSALLNSVPMAFQRSIEYRVTWNKVSHLRRRAYMLDPDITNEALAMQRIQPPLRDSEWALYAAASCNTALLTAPVYLQRCEGQGAVSQPTQKGRAILSSIDIKTHLFKASKQFPEFRLSADEIKKSYAQAYFEQAYFYFNNNKRLAAYVALFEALKIRLTPNYLRFALRMLLPRREISE